MDVTIIDGNHLLYRSVHKGVKLDLGQGTGQPTAGLYLFLKSLWGIKEYGAPIVIFDGIHSKFRTNIYPGYKVREHTTDELVVNMKKFTWDNIGRLLNTMGIPTVVVPEEADDVIYHLSSKFSPTCNVIAVSDDHDYLQMIQVGAKIYQAMKEKWYGKSNFKENFKFDLCYYTLWLALQGDTSDCITGINKVGPVTATKIIQAFAEESMIEPEENPLSVLSKLYEWSKVSDSKLKTLVINNFAIVKRNLFLIDLSLNNTVNVDNIAKAYTRSLERSEPNLDKLTELFTEYRFKSMGNWIALIGGGYSFRYPIFE